MVDLRPRLQAALGDAYQIDRELGGGGMSRVFLATEASLHRQVVIKVLPPELSSEVSQARFKQEIELAAHLQHTNILPVLAAGAKDDLLFYVMPFVSGESLRHRLTREGKLPVTDAVRYPLDPEGWYRLGEAFMHVGEGVREAADQSLNAFEQAIMLDSAFAPAYEHAIELLLERDPERARRYVATWLSLGPAGDEAAALRIVQRLLEPNGAAAIPDALLDSFPADVLYELRFFLRRYPDSTETTVRAARALAASRDGFRGFLSYTLGYHGRVREAYPLVASDSDNRIGFVELALLGGVPRDSAAARFGRWLRAGNEWANAASLWWTQLGDTGSIRAFARLAADSARVATLPSRRAYWTYDAAATAPYLALARRDTAAALRGFAALPDSLCPDCYLERYAQGRMLAVLGRNEEAALLLDQALVTPAYQPPSSVLWALERGRVNGRLGNRDKARAAFSFIATVWRHADPELQPYVTEAKAALARLTKEGH